MLNSMGRDGNKIKTRGNDTQLAVGACRLRRGGGGSDLDQTYERRRQKDRGNP